MHCAVCQNVHDTIVETCVNCGNASWHPPTAFAFTPVGIVPIGQDAAIAAEIASTPSTLTISQETTTDDVGPDVSAETASEDVDASEPQDAGASDEASAPARKRKGRK